MLTYLRFRCSEEKFEDFFKTLVFIKKRKVLFVKTSIKYNFDRLQTKIVLFVFHGLKYTCAGKNFLQCLSKHLKKQYFLNVEQQFLTDAVIYYLTVPRKSFQPFFRWKKNQNIVVSFWHWVKSLSNFVLSASQLPKRAFSANFYGNFENFRGFGHFAENHFVFWFHYGSWPA